MKSISKIKSLKNKTAILRADFNVPIKESKILDPFRITATLPTIDLLIKKGARIVILSHRSDEKGSLMPVFEYLKKKKYKITFEKSLDTETIKARATQLKTGEILLVENLRYSDKEEKNDVSFAKALASLGDIYVNDAFSVSHRKHASIVGIPKYIPGYAGLQLEQEIKMLSKVLKPSKTKSHPFFFILGGAKFETKLPLLKIYLEKADAVFVGGALANTLLKQKGYEVGVSLAEDKVKGIIPLLKNPKLLLPMDVVVIRNEKNETQTETLGTEEVEKEDKIVDVGSETLARIKPLIEKAKLIVWNGPIGMSSSGYDKGTIELLKLLANKKITKGETILGGGDTVEVVTKLKMHKKFTFVSTGGGATLDFLAKGTLPGIEAL